jgi:hypothetical protein
MKGAGEGEGPWASLQRTWEDGCLLARRSGGKVMLGK